MMKRPIAQLFLLGLIILPLVTPAVLSQGTHSLKWGVDPGEEFTYVLQRKIGDQVGFNYIGSIVPYILYLDEGQKMTVRITQLDPIPSEINSTMDEPKAYCDLIRENDSEVVISNFTGMDSFVIPISDWTFMKNLRNITEENGYTLIDTDTEWGYSASGLYPGSNDVHVYREIRYDKQNGTMIYHRWSFTQYSTPILEIILAKWEPGMPTILPLGTDLSLILLAGIAICLAIVCAFLTYRGFNKRTSIMKELGK